MSANASGRPQRAATLRFYWHLNALSETDGSAGARHGRPQLVRDPRPFPPSRADHHAQIARAVGMSGFDGLVASSEESEIIAAAARAAPHLLVVPELPASLASLVQTARQTAGFGRAPEQRLGWSVISADGSLRRHRLTYRPAADLAERSEELLRIAHDIARDPASSFKGRFFELEDGSFTAPGDRTFFPPVFLRGEQQATLEIAARARRRPSFRPRAAGVAAAPDCDARRLCAGGGPARSVRIGRQDHRARK